MRKSKCVKTEIIINEKSLKIVENFITKYCRQCSNWTFLLNSTTIKTIFEDSHALSNNDWLDVWS